MEYKWGLSRAYVKDSGEKQNVVCGFDAQMTCRNDQGAIGEYDVFVPVDTSDLSTFVELSDLTYTAVCSWADAYFDQTQLADIKAKAAERCAVNNCTMVNLPFGAFFK